jgi:hypothetical protein
MTLTNGDESEMNENPGHAPEPPLPGEQPWLEQFAASFSRPEDADVASRLGAAAFAAHLTTDKGDLAATSASKADGPSAKASGLPKWRTRMAAFGATLLSTAVGKVAVAAASVAVVAGGVAAADALASQPSGPDEVVVTSQQDDSADTDEVVEVDAVEVDDATDDAGNDTVNKDDDQGEDGDHQGAGGVSDDDQGEDADDQGDDSQGEDADDQGDDDQGEDAGDRGGSRDDDSDDADEDRSGSRHSDDADDDSDQHSGQDDSDSDDEDVESDD